MSWRPRRSGRLIIELVVFVVVSVVLSVVVVTSVLNLQTTSAHTYHAIVSDASGLRPGNNVKIAGINVGTVSGIGLYGTDAVRVTFSVDTGHHVYTDTQAAIRYANLIGTRYLDLSRPDAETVQSDQSPPLRPGGTIPESHTSPALDLTAVFNGFQPLFDALTPAEINQLTASIIQVFQGQSDTVSDLVTQIGTITQNLADRKSVIETVITNLAGVLSSVNSQGQALGQIVDNFDHVVDNFADQKDVLAQAITAMSRFTTDAASLTKQSSKAITQDITGVAKASQTLSRSQAAIRSMLEGAPTALNAIERTMDSGSYLKVYLCNLDLRTTGKLNISLVPGLSAPQPPTGVPLPGGSVAGASATHSEVCH